MIRKQQENGNSLLSSRLKQTHTPNDTPKDIPTLNAIRSKQHTTSSEIPNYESCAQDINNRTHSQNKFKKAKHKSTDEVWDKRSENLNGMPEAFDFDKDLEQESLLQSAKKEKVKVIRKHVSRIVTIGMILMCIYFAFLIYGVTQTYYIYDDTGKVRPEILSLEDKKNLSEYEALSEFYLRARILYEQTLSLDYRLSLEPENSLAIAMEYSQMLDSVAKLSVDINAASFSTAYSGIKAQLQTWVQTDIAVYLQNISSAITDNDATAANNAIISRDVMYNDFSVITSNLVSLCSSTKGAKNGDIFAWSPDGYIETLKGG